MSNTDVSFFKKETSDDSEAFNWKIVLVGSAMSAVVGCMMGAAIGIIGPGVGIGAIVGAVAGFAFGFLIGILKELHRLGYLDFNTEKEPSVREDFFHNL